MFGPGIRSLAQQERIAVTVCTAPDAAPHLGPCDAAAGAAPAAAAAGGPGSCWGSAQAAVRQPAVASSSAAEPMDLTVWQLQLLRTGTNSWALAGVEALLRRLLGNWPPVGCERSLRYKVLTASKLPDGRIVLAAAAPAVVEEAVAAGAEAAAAAAARVAKAGMAGAIDSQERGLQQFCDPRDIPPACPTVTVRREFKRLLLPSNSLCAFFGERLAELAGIAPEAPHTVTVYADPAGGGNPGGVTLPSAAAASGGIPGAWAAAAPAAAPAPGPVVLQAWELEVQPPPRGGENFALTGGCALLRQLCVPYPHGTVRMARLPDGRVVLSAVEGKGIGQHGCDDEEEDAAANAAAGSVSGAAVGGGGGGVEPPPPPASVRQLRRGRQAPPSQLPQQTAVQLPPRARTRPQHLDEYVLETDTEAPSPRGAGAPAPSKAQQRMGYNNGTDANDGRQTRAAAPAAPAGAAVSALLPSANLVPVLTDACSDELLTAPAREASGLGTAAPPPLSSVLLPQCNDGPVKTLRHKRGQIILPHATACALFGSHMPARAAAEPQRVLVYTQAAPALSAAAASGGIAAHWATTGVPGAFPPGLVDPPCLVDPRPDLDPRHLRAWTLRLMHEGGPGRLVLAGAGELLQRLGELGTEGQLTGHRLPPPDGRLLLRPVERAEAQQSGPAASPRGGGSGIPADAAADVHFASLLLFAQAGGALAGTPSAPSDRNPGWGLDPAGAAAATPARLPQHADGLLAPASLLEPPPAWLPRQRPHAMAHLQPRAAHDVCDPAQSPLRAAADAPECSVSPWRAVTWTPYALDREFTPAGDAGPSCNAWSAGEEEGGGGPDETATDPWDEGGTATMAAAGSPEAGGARWGLRLDQPPPLWLRAAGGDRNAVQEMASRRAMRRAAAVGLATEPAVAVTAAAAENEADILALAAAEASVEQLATAGVEGCSSETGGALRGPVSAPCAAAAGISAGEQDALQALVALQGNRWAVGSPASAVNGNAGSCQQRQQRGGSGGGGCGGGGQVPAKAPWGAAPTAVATAAAAVGRDGQENVPPLPVHRDATWRPSATAAVGGPEEPRTGKRRRADE
ncbi:hypothetical protein GPECTOR_95g684 [Gonium pectorale]|uniref:Uncharacterized protein n=1 Tax=Gonium pectorale TaxID=33097 RepID=A0A150G1E0_GONPE|nr:hypothetical protein GPECTOR_95g684 [Gonium pectorale]|eukprot:KXZ43295.1 hypothetical protein GPECTOR_95g684 [Gonium pectorale]